MTIHRRKTCVAPAYWGKDKILGLRFCLRCCREKLLNEARVDDAAVERF